MNSIVTKFISITSRTRILGQILSNMVQNMVLRHTIGKVNSKKHINVFFKVIIKGTTGIIVKVCIVYVYRRSFRNDTMFLNASHQIVNIVTLFQMAYSLTWPTFSHQNIKVQTRDLENLILTWEASRNPFSTAQPCITKKRSHLRSWVFFASRRWYYFRV